jgi:hypothetical protein
MTVSAAVRVNEINVKRYAIDSQNFEVSFDSNAISIGLYNKTLKNYMYLYRSNIRELHAVLGEVIKALDKGGNDENFI